MTDKQLSPEMTADELIEETFRTTMSLLQASYEGGQNEAIFQAISICAGMDKKMPHWLAAAFCEGWARYRGAISGPGDKPGKSTLGGAFGVVRPNNFKPHSARRWVYASLIWQFVERERKAGVPVDEYLFERAAELAPRDGGAGFYEAAYGFDLPESERRPIKASTAKNMYYDFIKRHGLSDKAQSVVQDAFLEAGSLAKYRED